MIAVTSVLAQATGTSGATPTPISAATKLVVPSVDWVALLPLIILMAGAIVMITLTSLLRGRFTKSAYAWYTVVVALAAIVASLPVWARIQGWTSFLWIDLVPKQPGASTTLGGAVAVDGFSVFIGIVICATVIVTALFLGEYLRREDLEGPEFFVLLLLSASGGLMMAMADDLIVLFLGLETLSIALYVMAAMHLRRAQSQEAGLKYFVLGAFSSAFFLYGIAMVYGATGSTNLVKINAFLSTAVLTKNGLLMLGFALLLVGFGFKVAAVPFHSWAPDVYDGAPTPATAFMSAAVKAAAFAGLVRVFMVTFSSFAEDWKPIVYALAVLSMVGGAVLAIVQTNVKRMLAYSSISHAGFILVAVAAATERGIQAVLFYVTAYTFMVVGSFAIVSVVGRAGDDHHTLKDYRGLARSNPVLSLVFTIFLLAQAGIPFTSGFFAKFYAIIAAVDARMYWLGVIAMLAAVVAAFLYLRLIIAMYMSGPEDAEEALPALGRVRVPFGAGLAIAICFVVTLGAGIFPSTVLDPARKATAELVTFTPPAAPGLGSGSLSGQGP